MQKVNNDYKIYIHNLIIDYNLENTIVFYNNLPKNSIITKYIEHNVYYVGHFLILNGKVIDKVYSHF